MPTKVKHLLNPKKNSKFALKSFHNNMVRVFISSVQREFAEERRLLCEYIRTDALLSKFFVPFIFEELPAINLSAPEAYLSEAATSDIYLGIYGRDYGYEDEEGVSPTEREYNTATEHNKYRIVFVKRCEERHPKEASFIKKVEQDVVRKSFANFEELRNAVYTSLIRYMEEYSILSDQPWDSKYHPTATMDDIDEKKVSGFVYLAREKRRSKLQFTGDNTLDILVSLNLATESGRLTNSALMLFGKNPQKFFPTSEVKCAIFYGFTVEKPVPFYQVYQGSIFELVDQAVGFVMNHIDAAVGTRNKSAQVDIDYELPVEAVTEAIVNACIHRTYTSNASVQVMLFRDRLEVISPGSTPEGITVEKLKQIHKSIPVNPTLAAPVYLAGYIERLGTGTLDMVRKCEEKGLRTPTFTLKEDVTTIIWRKECYQIDHCETHVTPNVTPDVAQNDPQLKTEKEALRENVAQSDPQSDPQNVTPNVTPPKNLLRIKDELTTIISNKYITAEELASQFGVTVRTIRRDFNLLRDSYKIEWKVLSPKTGYWEVEPLHK